VTHSDWEMIGAIGQWVGAIATFGAVALALWQVRSDRRVSLRLRPSHSLIFSGDGTAPEHVLAFSIANTGFRPVTVQSVGWESGWLRRFGPSFLRKRQAIQMMDRPAAPRLPSILQPGESITVMADAEHVFGRDAYSELFTRTLPIVGVRNANVRAVVHTTLRSVSVPVERKLVDQLRGVVPL
jgi:hypothetical protein